MIPLPPIVNQASPPFQSLNQIVKDLANRQISSRQLVEQCLDQVSRLDDQVKAWVMVDEKRALAAAKEADRRRNQRFFGKKTRYSLRGIPFGVKDIIDVRGWPTEAGFSPWKGRTAEKDAAVISKLCNSGMIPIGKTVTTQFASIDPPATTNPYNLQRTPGGSSSGSCAAVACRMVPMALGSQTGGSINRPASFCGVAGLKMQYDLIPVTGVVPCSPSLDTLGLITPAVADLAMLASTFFRTSVLNDDRRMFYRGLSLTQKDRLKIARLTGRFAELAEPEMLSAVDDAEIRLKAGKHTVETVDASEIFNDVLWQTHRRIMLSECAVTHRQWFDAHPEAYLPKIRTWVEEGQAIGPEHQKQFRRDRDRIFSEFIVKFQEFDAILVPAARGEAPTPETTGDPVFNAPWTLLGVPSLTVPIRLSSSGLPLSVQLAATSFKSKALGRLIATGLLLDGSELLNDQ